MIRKILFLAMVAGTACILSCGIFSGRKRPNVILVSIDTCRADHLGCYGYSRDTSPNIDRVASEGILFNHAFTPVPVTLPAHSSMLTGRIPPAHRVRDNDNYRLGQSQTTLAEILRDNGYSTCAVIGSFVLNSRTGLDQGFESYEDGIGDEDRKSDYYYNERSAGEVTELAKRWLDENRDDEFFLFLHYYDLHAPYKQHVQYDFRSDKPVINPSGRWLDRVEYVSGCVNRYDSEIAYVDAAIGRVVEKLKELSLYDSSLLIITSDHGEGFGEHSEGTHSYFIYNSTLHVPLIMKFPGETDQRSLDAPVGLVDIVPTVCGLLDLPVPEGLRGRDLTGYRFGEVDRPGDRFLYCESLLFTKFGFDPLLGLVRDNWKYIHGRNGQLYDLETDPSEENNLAEKEPSILDEMRKELKSILEDGGYGSSDEVNAGVDGETRARLRSLGYVTNFAPVEDIRFDRIDVDTEELVEHLGFIEDLLLFLSKSEDEKAKELCEDFLKKRPDCKEAYFYLGTIAASQNDLQAAAGYFTRYLDLANRGSEEDALRVRNDSYALSTAYNCVGSALWKEGKVREAIAHYEKALAYDPTLKDVAFNLAGLYLNQGDPARAVKYYRKTLELDPDNPNAHFNLGNIFLRIEKFGKSIMHFQKALALKPDWLVARQRLAQAEKLRSQSEKRIDSWLNSLRTDPDQPELLYKLSLAMQKRDELDESVRYLEEALALKPDWPEVINRLALLRMNEHVKSSDLHEAVRLAKRACELTQYSDPVLLKTLTVAYAKSGMKVEAVQTAQRALDLVSETGNEKSITRFQNLLRMIESGSPETLPRIFGLQSP